MSIPLRSIRAPYRWGMVLSPESLQDITLCLQLIYRSNLVDISLTINGVTAQYHKNQYGDVLFIPAVEQPTTVHPMIIPYGVRPDVPYCPPQHQEVEHQNCDLVPPQNETPLPADSVDQSNELNNSDPFLPQGIESPIDYHPIYREENHSRGEEVDAIYLSDVSDDDVSTDWFGARRSPPLEYSAPTIFTQEDEEDTTNDTEISSFGTKLRAIIDKMDAESSIDLSSDDEDDDPMDDEASSSEEDEMEKEKEKEKEKQKEKEKEKEEEYMSDSLLMDSSITEFIDEFLENEEIDVNSFVDDGVDHFPEKEVINISDDDFNSDDVMTCISGEE